LKATLRAPNYIAYMGGYMGSDGQPDIHVLAKKQYRAGVVGLSRDTADPIAFDLASHLN
jgi:hypothetical protein